MHRVFTAAQFTAAKTWKQPRARQQEWVEAVGIHTTERDAAVKGGSLTFGTARRGLESLMLSDVSQSEKDTCHMTSLI